MKRARLAVLTALLVTALGAGDVSAWNPFGRKKPLEAADPEMMKLVSLIAVLPVQNQTGRTIRRDPSLFERAAGWFPRSKNKFKPSPRSDIPAFLEYEIKESLKRSGYSVIAPQEMNRVMKALQDQEGTVDLARLHSVCKADAYLYTGLVRWDGGNVWRRKLRAGYDLKLIEPSSGNVIWQRFRKSKSLQLDASAMAEEARFVKLLTQDALARFPRRPATAEGS